MPRRRTAVCKNRVSCVSSAVSMRRTFMVSADECFLFDIQGYLHLHGALRQDEVSELLRLVEENMGKDIATINEEPSHAAHQLNRPLSRMIDADVRLARLHSTVRDAGVRQRAPARHPYPWKSGVARAGACVAALGCANEPRASGE